MKYGPSSSAITKYGELGNQISYLLLRIAIQLSEIESQIRTYGTDVSIYESEIHMLSTIKETEDIHISGLAETWGVTKGAVSQLIGKLHKKGLVEKALDENNLSRVKIRLTSKGETAQARHEDLHAQFEQLMQYEVQQYSQELQDFLAVALKGISTRLEKWEE
jgi:Transcriptional regulators